jgi:hypothetical protein
VSSWGSRQLASRVAAVSPAMAVLRRRQRRARHRPTPREEGAALIERAGFSAVEDRPRPRSGQVRAARRDPSLVGQLFETDVLMAANLDFSEELASGAIIDSVHEESDERRRQEEAKVAQLRAAARADVRRACSRPAGARGPSAALATATQRIQGVRSESTLRASRTEVFDVVWRCFLRLFHWS